MFMKLEKWMVYFLAHSSWIPSRSVRLIKRRRSGSEAKRPVVQREMQGV